MTAADEGGGRPRGEAPAGSAAPPPRPPLDVRGTFCPLPVLLTERALAGLAPGQRLTVIGDDPAIHGDVPAWCAESGHRLVELVELAGGEIRFVVERAPATTGGGPPRRDAPAAP